MKTHSKLTLDVCNNIFLNPYISGSNLYEQISNAHLLFIWVDTSMFSHDMTIIRCVWSSHLQGNVCGNSGKKGLCDNL